MDVRVGLKESWGLKNWCFWTVVLEKTLESPLDCKEIQPVHPKGNQSWVFIGRTDVEAETPILCPPDAKSWLIWRDPDVGKDWRQKEKGMTEEEMVRWHHRLNGQGVWVNSGSWWWTGRPGMLWFMGSQRVGHDWVTELNWYTTLTEWRKKTDDHLNKWRESIRQNSTCFMVKTLNKSCIEGIYLNIIRATGFPSGSVVKNPSASAGEIGSIPEWGRSHGKGMATHSSILAWEIPRTEEPGRLQSIGSQRVRHDSVTKTQ